MLPSAETRTIFFECDGVHNVAETGLLLPVAEDEDPRSSPRVPFRADECTMRIALEELEVGLIRRRSFLACRQLE